MTRRTRLFIEALEDRRTPSFSPAVTYAAGTDPQAVVTADFNNDSILDIAVANTGSGTVGVLLGNANGTFQAAIHAPAGNQPTSLAVGDFNEDGTLDVATAAGYPGSYPNDVTVLLGTGNGMFGPPSGYQVGFGYGVDTLAAGDFNADGNLDLAVTALHFEDGGSDGSYAGVLMGTGAGTFTTLPEWPWEGGWSRFGGTELLPDSVVADSNGNMLGFIAAPSYYGQLPVAMSYGDGTFGDTWVYSGATEASSIVAADFNADGVVDFAIGGNSSVSVVLGFGTPRMYYAGSGSISDVAVADFNGDGKLDLIATNSSNGTVSALLGTGGGAFAPPVTVAVGAAPTGVAVGDFNGDGRADVVSVNSASGNVSVLLNDGGWDGPPSPAPSLSITDVSKPEGNWWGEQFVFAVTLSAPTATPVTVNYSTANGTAIAGSDYNSASGTVTIPPGETVRHIFVTIHTDTTFEADETFFVNLVDAVGAPIADGSGVGTIQNDDTLPSIRISDVTQREGRNGNTLFTFTVTLSAPSETTVTVNYSTANGTAVAGSDYEAASGTLTFAPGETTKTITINVKGDRKKEANESFYLDLFGNSSNSLLIDARGVGTIVNDD